MRRAARVHRRVRDRLQRDTAGAGVMAGPDRSPPRHSPRGCPPRLHETSRAHCVRFDRAVRWVIVAGLASRRTCVQVI